MTATAVIIDCDPGLDDAVALLLAFARPELDVRAVTVVAGNQTLPRVLDNCLRLLSYAGIRGVPVAAGCDGPLIRPVSAIGRVTEYLLQLNLPRMVAQRQALILAERYPR